jgi:hypothetical protein
MAVITNDLAFFGDHAVAALGAGVKKLLGLVDVRTLFCFPAEIEE